jgi:hypothetical protein
VSLNIESTKPRNSLPKWPEDSCHATLIPGFDL